jgi:protein SCO1
VAQHSKTHSGDYFFLLASVTAAIAAVFMVTVWAPLQMRAFTDATESMPAQTTVESAGWTRVPLMTSDGTTTSLAASNGVVRVVTMMYTHCPGVCPLAVSTLQRIESRLTSIQQRRVSIIALSLDPERDSIARLQTFRSERGIESKRWIVARPSAEGVRQLAAGLGVDYRLQGDDTIDHQSVFVLLDKSGHVLARTPKTQSVDPSFLGALETALNVN